MVEYRTSALGHKYYLCADALSLICLLTGPLYKFYETDDQAMTSEYTKLFKLV